MYLGTQDGGPLTNHTDGTGQRHQSFWVKLPLWQTGHTKKSAVVT